MPAIILKIIPDRAAWLGQDPTKLPIDGIINVTGRLVSVETMPSKDHARWTRQDLQAMFSGHLQAELSLLVARYLPGVKLADDGLLGGPPSDSLSTLVDEFLNTLPGLKERG